jgi:N-acyl-D-amino-acid deacylase
MTEVDVLVENARIVDGTGAPWFRGAVGIRNGIIDRIVRDEGADIDAAERIDVGGDVICPGFIDTHSHSDLQLFADGALKPKTRQGITTEILGQDGFSMAPLYDDAAKETWRQHLSGLAGDVDVDWNWNTTGEYFDAIEESGIAPNVAMLVSHGTVRFNVLGMADRAPTDDELEEMGDLVTESLEAGAIGYSTGLVYSPQVNASAHETRELAARLTPYGRPFVAHIRSEGRWIWEALDEFVDIGAELGIPLHLSHYKVVGSMQHGKADRANHPIETARERGVDFTAEQYPYTAGNTLLSAVLPPWVHTDGPDETLDRPTDNEM